MLEIEISPRKKASGSKDSEGEAEGSEYEGEASSMAAEEFSKALKSGDSQAILDSFRTMMDICSE